MRPILSALVVLGLTLNLNGCFRYSFSGAMTGDVRTVAIPLFDNRTAEYGVVEQITDNLILTFQKDNTLQIADEETADAVLRGTLVRVIDAPYTYEGEGEAQDFTVGEYKLTLYVSLDYYDLRKGEMIWSQMIWSQDVQGWGTYQYVSGAPEERDAGFTEAIRKLSEDVLNLTVSGW
jgi:hypothetical protein